MKYIESKKKPLLYRFIRFCVRIFYRKREYLNMELLPEEPSIIVSNHCQTHGPLSNEMFYPRKKYIWCIGNMMNIKDVPSYAYEDFWSKKPKWIRWFYKLLSYIIAPIASYIFTHADTIGVYKDSRIIKTFKESVNQLNNGYDIVIFPENRDKFNNIINDFQDKFIDVARLYYSKYKKCISFVPMYNSPALKKLVFGKPIKYDPNITIEEQREIICNYLKKEITSIAENLPLHKVYTYENISSRKYKYNKPKSND